MFCFCFHFKPTRPIFLEIWNKILYIIQYLTLRIWDQGHGQNRPKSNQVIHRSGPSILPKMKEITKIIIFCDVVTLTYDLWPWKIYHFKALSLPMCAKFFNNPLRTFSLSCSDHLYCKSIFVMLWPGPFTLSPMTLKNYSACGTITTIVWAKFENNPSSTFFSYCAHTITQVA